MGNLAVRNSQKRAREDTEETYFQVRAKLIGTRKSKGFRSEVYSLAEDSRGYYCLEGKEQSIFYDGDSQDLTISILFKSEDNARDFQKHLNKMGIEYFGDAVLTRLKVTRQIEKIASSACLDPIFTTDYVDADNEESPPSSLKDVLSSVSSFNADMDPERTLQALESPQYLFVIGSKWYHCHLISSKVKKYENDPDNALYASWLFYQHFDGLNTVYGLKPSVAVQFVSVGPQERVVVDGNGREDMRYRILVLVRCKDETVASILSVGFKTGVTRATALTFESFIYARDANKMKLFLDTKYKAANVDDW